jgi:hypothetical protein
MRSDFLDSHHLAELVNVLRQSPRDSLIRIEELHVFDQRLSGVRTKEDGIIAVDLDPRRTGVQVADDSALLSVHFLDGLMANMTEGMELFAGYNLDESRGSLGRDRLLGNTDSLEGKIFCYV